MESRKCNNCQKQFKVPPMAKTARCKCQALCSVGRNHNVSTAQKGIQPSSSFSTRLWRRLSSISSSSSNSNIIEIERERERESFPWVGNGVNPLNSTTSGSHQSRKAVLCGVSYKKDKYELKGTINDVKNMWNLLTELKFPKDAICVLTEEENDTTLFPTKQNMKRAFKWLAQDCRDGDSLIFYFSGHGVRQPDFDDDEVDGYNETLCPVDFKTSGMIFDNHINDAIVKPLKSGVKLHAIIDACHSGTVIDLEYVYNRAKNCWIGNKPPCGANKSTDGGIAISLSACADDRLAADTTAFSRDMMSGALTYVFANIMRQKGGKVTYADLLNDMKEKIESVNSSRNCMSTPLMKRLFRSKIIQEPQLSASREIDINGLLSL